MAVWLAALIVAAGVVLHFTMKPAEPSPPATPSPATRPAESPAPTVRSFAPPHEVAEQEAAAVGQNGLPVLPRDKVEEYLARHHRDAASLLAALHATGDTNYLREAATNFPGDPRLQYTLLARDVFPGERRKWLDAFKASAPSNSLANYLSAAEYFKDGQRDAALAELQAAYYKKQFDNYATESLLDAEELCRDSGLSQLMSSVAAISGVAEDFLPELAMCKRVATGAADAQKDYSAAGDPQGALAVTGMGLALANQLRSGDSGKYLIREMVGNAAEAIMLKQLDQNTPYDFLGGMTPAQRLAEMNQWKAEVRKLSASFNEQFLQLSEAQQMNYLQRARIYGEVEARRWLQEQYAATAGGQK